MGELERAYVWLISKPGLLLAVLAGVLLLAAGFASRFSFDASSETLVAKDDPDLAAHREVADRFGGDDFLFVTFAPHEGALLDPQNLTHLIDLQDRLAAIPNVISAFSLLDAPLLKSPPMSIDELAAGIRTLRSPDTDYALAAVELAASPLFRDLLISSDGRTGVVRVEFSLAQSVGATETIQQRRARVAELDRLIRSVRTVRDEFSDRGEIHLGGVPMITADMVRFIERDLATFGALVLVLVTAMLYATLRQWRWVALPLLAAGATILATIGLLGYIYVPATVISSNFIALLMILTISLNIHLIVRYRELARRSPDLSRADLIVATMTSKFAPCLYTALTTMAAFGSLLASRIVPVEDFGWMMCVGVFLSLWITFLLFPAVLMLLDRGRPGADAIGGARLIGGLRHAALERPRTILAVAVVAIGVTAIGIGQLTIDNRFVDYFKEDTDINRGMVYIDQNLGGTAPLNVVLAFEPWFLSEASDPFLDQDPLDADDFFLAGDTFDDESADPFPDRYWFTRDKLDRIGQVHDFLEAQPEIGKVVSLASLDRLAADFLGGERLDNVQIAAILAAIPEDLLGQIIHPYASPSAGQMRLWARVIESGPYFDRSALVARIRAEAETAGFLSEQVTVAGMVVMFDAMLRKLVSSQVETLGFVVAAAFLMLLILLRSPLFAVLGLIPNLLAAAAVLGVMGLAGLSLDMMTTTIAAVSVGIGVDFAVHYLHRYRRERSRSGSPNQAISATHDSIGSALYLTAIIIMVGFAVLAFSNFVPTITFGLLVAVAMGFAFLANLTLLPTLLALTDSWLASRQA